MVRARRQHWLWMLLVVLISTVGIFCVAIVGAHAQDTVANLTTVGIETGLSGTDPRIILARIIRAVLSVVGIILVILVLYAGFLWMTASGNPAQVEKAQKILINAGIGLVIIIASLSITQFVLNQLLGATGFGSGSRDDAEEIYPPFSSSLGAGIIDNHFPRRNASEVPRNTNIVVTFNAPIDPASVMASFDASAPEATYDLEDDVVVIRVTDPDDETDLGLPLLTGADVRVAVTPDFQTFVFDPVPLLGTAAQNVDYTVELNTDISLLDGSPAFSGVDAGGYNWSFDVSTVVDLTPPTVDKVIPVASSVAPRNVLVQVHYSEPINPVSAVGTAPSFTNIQLSDTAIVAGSWSLGNGYETSEFVSDASCGENACGEEIFCLPATAALTGLVRSATLSEEPPTALLPYSGVVDMAGNALDGNGDGDAGDSYTWSFDTNDTIVLDPPTVVDINPPLVAVGVPAQNIPFDSTVNITFDTIMSVASINSRNMTLHSPSGGLWFSFGMDVVDSSGAPVDEPSLLDDRSRVDVNHGIFSESFLYGLETTSDVRSIFQNCFVPSASNACEGESCCNDNASSTRCTYSP